MNLFQLLRKRIELIIRFLTKNPMDFVEVDDLSTVVNIGDKVEVEHLTLHDCADFAIRGALTQISLWHNIPEINAYTVQNFSRLSEHVAVTTIQPCRLIT